MSFISLLKDQTSRTRSVTKALTWRVTATLTTTLLVYVLSSEVSLAMLIGGVEFALKFVIYYVHERAWNLIR